MKLTMYQGWHKIDTDCIKSLNILRDFYGIAELLLQIIAAVLRDFFTLK